MGTVFVLLAIGIAAGALVKEFRGSRRLQLKEVEFGRAVAEGWTQAIEVMRSRPEDFSCAEIAWIGKGAFRELYAKGQQVVDPTRVIVDLRKLMRDPLFQPILDMPKYRALVDGLERGAEEVTDPAVQSGQQVALA